MSLIKSLVKAMTEIPKTRINFSSSSIGVLSKGLAIAYPALFTKRETVYFLEIQKLYIALGESGSSKSAANAATFTGNKFINSVTAVCNFLSFRAVRTKSYPLAAKLLAISNPIPEEAPVINATLFFKILLYFTLK